MSVELKLHGWAYYAQAPYYRLRKMYWGGEWSQLAEKLTLVHCFVHCSGPSYCRLECYSTQKNHGEQAEVPGEMVHVENGNQKVLVVTIDDMIGNENIEIMIWTYKIS